MIENGEKYFMYLATNLPFYNGYKSLKQNLIIRMKHANNFVRLLLAILQINIITSCNWQQTPGTGIDIGVGLTLSNQESVWVIGGNKVAGCGNEIFYYNINSWKKVDGCATRIAVAPDGNPW